MTMIDMADDEGGDPDRTIAVNAKRIFRYVLGRRLEKDCAEFIEREASQRDLLPQVQDAILPRASARFADNFELCRYLSLPFLDEVREEFARGLCGDKFSMASKRRVSLWDMERLSCMSHQDLQEVFPQYEPHQKRLFPRLRDELSDQDLFEVYALQLHDERAPNLLALPNGYEDRQKIERQMLDCQGVVLTTSGALEVIAYDTEFGQDYELRVVNKDSYRIGVLFVDRKAAFPLLVMLRSSKGLQVQHQASAHALTLTFLESNLTSHLRIASTLAAPDKHDPDFWQHEALHGEIRRTTAFSCEGSTWRLLRLLGMRLNKSQFCTVESIVDPIEADSRGLPVGSRTHLVQGPPGTGKTQTLAVLLNALQNLKHRALVCAKSNMAVKELMERVISERLTLDHRSGIRKLDAASEESHSNAEEDDMDSLDDGTEIANRAHDSQSSRAFFSNRRIADCLQPECWLDDACVTWYFSRLRRNAPEELLLVDPTVATLLNGLEFREWNHAVDISVGLEFLRRHLIILPVSDARLGGHDFSGSHWSLLVARRSLGGWYYEYYDSLHSNHQFADRLAAKVNALLEDDWTLFNDVPEIEIVDAPLQTNGFDCGIFMLASASHICETFLTSPRVLMTEAVDATCWRRTLLDMLHSDEEETFTGNQYLVPCKPQLKMARSDLAGNAQIHVGLSEIVLVANEKTAKLSWACLQAKVFLDFRKKRIKRIAKFWLGEGHGVRKPFLSQPPWADRGCDALTPLLCDPQQAWTLWKSSYSYVSEGVACLSWAWTSTEEHKLAENSFTYFLYFAFRSLIRVVDAQVVQIFEDVPSDDVKPWILQSVDTMQAYRDVQLLRKKLVCLQSALKVFVAQLSNGIDHPSCKRIIAQRDTSTSSPSSASAVPAFDEIRSKDQTFRVIRAVTAAARGLVPELVDLLCLHRSGPSGCEVPVEELRKAKKRLWLLVHPDKVSVEFTTLATEAVKILPRAWENLCRSCTGMSVRVDEEMARTATSDVSNSKGDSAFGTVSPTVFRDLKRCASELREIAIFVRMADRNLLKEALVAHSSLIFSTASSSGRHWVRKQAIPVVLLDEACQCEESSTLVTLHPNVKHLILVGDPAQLPATVISKLAERMHYGRSTFERLIQIGHVPRLLDIQYRMDPDIIEWPNFEFYGGQLQTSEHILHRDRNAWFNTTTVSRAVSWRLGTFRIHDTSRCMWLEERSGNSFRNRAEAEYIVCTLREFKQAFDPKNNLDIGIVTPYKAQQVYIEQLLSQSDNKWLEAHARVSTVDGFQGQECHVIVISTVRTGERIGFVRDWRRLNVAITRAMLKCWIVGNVKALENAADVWQTLADHARSRGWLYDVSMLASNSEESAYACEEFLALSHEESYEQVPADIITGNGAIWEALGSVEVFEHPIVGASPLLHGHLSKGDRCLQDGTPIFVHGTMFVHVLASGIQGWVKALSVSDLEGPWLKLLLDSPDSRLDGNDANIGITTSLDLRNPFELFFTHDTIRPVFRNGSAIDDTIKAILERKLSPWSFPPLDVTRNPDDGKLYSLSNRRLFTFRVGCNLGSIERIPVKIHAFTSDFVQKMRKGSSKWKRSLTTNNGGISVEVSSEYAEFQWPERDVKLGAWADPARNGETDSYLLRDF